ncbi:MAG: peptide-methionine (R)-S-oxide reductase MsrB [Caulobacteraceae bacterium]
MAKGRFRVMKTEAEWRRVLTPAQFQVLRQENTERPFTSPLNNEHRRGVFVCAACAWPLFSSAAKYDSGTGWPSFWQPINARAVGASGNLGLLFPYKEIHCANCGGHLGHVFNDGPKPTGLRYCMNGVALKFRAG